MITNTESGTNVHEIAEGIYRINTPLSVVPGGFSFNQYLVVDEEPLLFHTGLKRMFPLVREAIARVIPVEQLRYLAFSHFESDECGALNSLLAAAPRAVPVCSQVAAMVSVEDFADRAPRPLAHGETIRLGKHAVRWVDAPHMPHGWETGLLFEETTRTLFCGDLFTQGGTGDAAVTESDILGPSEAFRKAMDYYSHSKNAGPILAALAATGPTTLACMHGSAWRGDGGALLRELARSLAA
jgi:flavorubredoxin